MDPTQEAGFQPQMGRLPPDPNKPRLYVAEPTWAVPAPLLTVDHLTGVPIEWDGNNVYGDCVVKAIRDHFYVTWMALKPGVPVPPITAQDCLEFYWVMTGCKGNPPGPGLTTEKALDHALKFGLGGQFPLAWAAVRHDWTADEQVNSEFVAGIYGVAIHQAQMWPSSLFDDVDGPLRGWHEMCGGRHDPTYLWAITWTYQTRMTRSYVANDLDEHHVIIWPHVWDNLTVERRTQIATDYTALTGKPWPGEAPITPVPPYVTRTTAMPPFWPPATRVYDGRPTYTPINVLKGKLASGETRRIYLPGTYTLKDGTQVVIPTGLVACAGNLTITNPGPGGGWAALTPGQYVGPSSTVNWEPTDHSKANAFDSGVNTDDSICVHNGSPYPVDVIIDLTRYDTK